ncbi:MAG TPA: metallophosphoesterase [Solirubrobacteraceae bacterium]|nr:metallophosphoesterase [Solirubrobacteraceae bacterium]
MRTLVISDLHLGSRLGHDVLRRPDARERLLDALDGIDRLVLLGDSVELMEGRPQQALAVAEPVLREIGARLGAERRVMLVPGNHDAPLVRAWVRAQDSALGPSSPVPGDASPALAQLVEWLEPARVQIRYPGAWLSERVWATHGHYLDRHLLPESAYGVLGRSPSEHVRPIDYELAQRPSMSRVSGRLPRPLAALLDDVAELARAATMPRLIRRHLLRARFAPLTAAVLSAQMRRASIPALVRVVERLGIDAEWVIFGHVHRLGPLAEDAPEVWRGSTGRPRLANTGSWVHEPLLVHRSRASYPYWPGGAVLLDDGDEPRAISLLGGP